MEATIELYDLKAPAPMMPGMAINQIMKDIGGTLKQAGIVTNPPKELDGHGIYYLKSERGGSEAESLWIDNGCEVTCWAFELGKGWAQTETSKESGYKSPLPLTINLN